MSVSSCSCSSATSFSAGVALIFVFEDQAEHCSLDFPFLIVRKPIIPRSIEAEWPAQTAAPFVEFVFAAGGRTVNQPQ